jgi:hypothetical protein
MTRLWRIGASTAAKPGPNDSIWEYDPAEPADEQGRRKSDRLVGSLPRPYAVEIVELVNLLGDGARTFVSDALEGAMIEVGERLVTTLRGGR